MPCRDHSPQSRGPPNLDARLPPRKYSAVHRSALLVSALAVVAFCGCGSSQTEMEIRGVAPLNRNEHDEDLPIDVRIYPLKDDARFMNADFDELWRDDKKALGDSRLGDPKQITVFPARPDDPPV